MYMDLIRTVAEKEGQTMEEAEQRAAAAVPLKRANEPEDIAATIVFLASPAARNVSGQAFNVDGGLVPH
jgi:NAD(P)-dependent dehydrogenase (short-subunit alcohol dehydrogenase family)